MEIVRIRNKHIDTLSDYGYGCVCHRCGTIYIADINDIIVPDKDTPQISDLQIKCPNKKCGRLTSLTHPSITRFNNSTHRHSFKYL